MRTSDPFDRDFKLLIGHDPLRWQRRLFHDHFMRDEIPQSLDLPTGLGKTSVMAIWYLARTAGANLPRRLVYVVDRRTVVDQATRTAEDIKTKAGCENLRVSTLRGQYADNRQWLEDPSAPAIIVGTVDMIGSRLLFSGYGTTRKMRPYQAGLLGIDALIVLDEAHLVPPFAHLLRAIETDNTLQAKVTADRKMLPPFRILPLSATQRDRGEELPGRKPFRLQQSDWQDDAVTTMRLQAGKRLHLHPLAPENPDTQLADKAWELASTGARFLRVVVFCDRRDKDDKTPRPTAKGVAEALAKRAKHPSGGDGSQQASIQLLVGGRRVHEREKVAKDLTEVGFIGTKSPLSQPAFLVATSAGEVGADIDADHLVCDMVAWERMVQRLGRVNRRGECQGGAEVHVFWSQPSAASSKTEPHASIACRTKAVIECLPQCNGTYDVSPGTLRQFTERSQDEADLKARIQAATTPEPLRPALTRALVDAWSMTWLEHHTGRPEVAPWLRGWVEEQPQTTIIWRRYLPLRPLPAANITKADKRDIDDFFEAAAPHQTEMLETETYRAAELFAKRAKDLLAYQKSSAQVDPDEHEASSEQDAGPDTDASAESDNTARKNWRKNDVVALLLGQDGSYCDHYTLDDLSKEQKSSGRQPFQEQIIGKTLVVDADFGCLKDGMLDAEAKDRVETADSDAAWTEITGFCVRYAKPKDETLSERAQPPDLPKDKWRREFNYDLKRDEDGNPFESLIVWQVRATAGNDNTRAIAPLQELDIHQDEVRMVIERITEPLTLPNTAKAALAICASLHDEGKRAPHWQRAFNAPKEIGSQGVKFFAKTPGPLDQRLLRGYRHEFGSLRFLHENADFQALGQDWQELILHLVAAHHGRARPLIETDGCEGGWPPHPEQRACEAALRFARLQARWGPWGLAWWEILLRAADQIASQGHDQNPQPNGKPSA